MGNGLADAAWCSFIGQMANSHEMSGILQACYALGATIAPLIATALSAEGQPGWFAFYYVMTAASVVEFVTLTATFWTQTGAVYLFENPTESGGKSGRTRQALKNKLSWIFAIFVFGYCGAEGKFSDPAFSESFICIPWLSTLNIADQNFWTL